MPRICGASCFLNGSLTNKSRTRKSRRNRGHRIQSRKDRAALAEQQKKEIA